MFKSLYEHLKKEFKVYSLGQPKGICTEPYLMIYESDPEDAGSKSLEKSNVEIWIYYPFGEYSQVEDYIKKVENSIKKYKKLRKIGKRSAIKVDTEMDAYFTNLSYYRLRYRGGK